MKSSAALIERSDQSVSTSDMSRRYTHYMGLLASGEQDRLVVMKAGRPLAVCMSIQEFEKIQSELTMPAIEGLEERLATEYGLKLPIAMRKEIEGHLCDSRGTYR